MSVRAPRAWMQLSSGRVNLKHCEVVLSRLAQGSSFFCEMALDDDTNPGIAFWSQGEISASIVATNGDGTGEKVLLEGQVDMVEVILERRIVIAHGTDLMSKLADTRSDQQFPNMTRSQIVAMIAAKHGLTPHIDGTAEMAGKSHDGQDYAHLTDHENELDLVQQLASEEGKVAFVVGRDLYFTDPGNVVGSSFPITYTPPQKGGPPPEMNGQTLKLMRNVQLGDIKSTVATFHPYEKQPFVGDAEIPVGTPGSVDSSTGAVVPQSSGGWDEKGFE